jgi:quinol monooxygenase YgiN
VVQFLALSDTIIKMNDDDKVLMILETTKVAKFKNRTSKALRHLAFLEAKKGHGQELMTILLTLVKPTLEEDKNIAYVPHFSFDNPDEILFDEIWGDKEAIDKHLRQPYMKDLLPKIQHLLAKPLILKTYSEVKVSNE